MSTRQDGVSWNFLNRLGTKSVGRRRLSESRLGIEVLEERRLLSVTPQLLKDLLPGSTSSMQFVTPEFTLVGQTEYFAASNGSSSGLNLWRSDGTTQGTMLVPTIGSGQVSVYGTGFGAMANANGTLFFAGPGKELWKTDGTAAGTAIVKDINPNGGAGLNFNLGPENLTNVSGTLFFTANDGVHGNELWKTDGTAAGTVMVKDISSITSSVNLYMRSFTNVNGTLFFLDNDGSHGEELWKSDGTAAGTVMVDDINPTGDGFDLESYLTEVNGTLFFRANDGTHGQELWKSDGTAAGTVMVKDINPGSAKSYPFALTNVNATLFFDANDGIHGYELWKSDGTAAGTAMIQDIRPGSSSSSPGGTNVNGNFFFTANDGTHGFELWKSDGTSAGTVMIKDTNPGPGGYGVSGVTNVNGSIFFSGDDGTHHRQLWTSDGTTQGTFQFNSIGYPGESLPLDFTNFNGALIFTANDGTHGFEPWIVPGLAIDLNGDATTGTDFTSTWTTGPVTIAASTATIAETGPTNLLSMTASLDNPQNGDVLAANTSGTAITAAFDGTTLSLSGDDTLQNYQQVMRSITFNNSHGHPPAVVSETVTIKAVNELHSPSSGAVATIILDQSPALDLNGAAPGIDFSQSWVGSAVSITDPTATLSDPDSNTLASLTAQLFSPKTGDLLAANTTGTNITASYSGGLLTLSGADSVAHYQQVLRSITYNNANATPSADAKTIALTAYDSTGASSSAVTSIAINYLPSLSIGSISQGEGNSGNVPFIFTVRLSDVRNHTITVKYATADGTASVADNDYATTSGTLFFAAGVMSQQIVVLVRGDTVFEQDESFSVNLTSPVNAVLAVALASGTIINDDVPPPQLLRDINTGSGDSSPSGFVAVGGTVYFSANDGTHGVELWKTDGTAAGTMMVTDISAGGASSYPASLTNVNDTLFFTANDGTDGQELWKSDGTVGGTVLVADIAPGGASSSPVQLTNVNGTLFFAANDGTDGQELWKSDGTAGGTVLVADIASGGASSSPVQLTNVNGTLFFAANDGTDGQELWKSDGTVGGTVLVKDIAPGGASSSPVQLTNVSGTLYFAANDGTDGQELWTSDGTAAGTMLVKDINPGAAGSSPSGLMNANGFLFFQANDGTHGAELWTSDGTAAGTVMVRNINPGSASSAPYSLTNVNGALFFKANDGTHGTELWTSDGTAAGTVMVQDIRPGSGSSAPYSLTNVNGTLFFTANDGTTGYELWKSDGTAAGTVLVQDISPGGSSSSPGSLTNMFGTLFFSATDGVTGVEPWVLAPPPPTVGFSQLAVSQPEGNSGTTPFVFTVTLSGASLQTVTVGYATADGTATVAESDYTAASGTLTFAPGQTVQQLTVLVNGNTGYEFDESFAVNLANPVDALLTTAQASGTIVNDDPALPTPPQLLKNLGFGKGSNPTDLVAVGGALFFLTNDSTHPGDLWRSDGTTAGTVDLKGFGTPSISDLTNINGTLYFYANLASGSSNSGLWKSDGTVAGTVRVSSAGSTNLTNVNGTIFFSGGPNLWKSDGTTAGTVLVKSGPFIEGLSNVNGKLFFAANDGTHGYELWKSDGTANGTAMVKDINPGSGNAFPNGFNNIGNSNGVAVFSANDGTHGLELWKSDGTAAGTTMIMDINPGSAGSNDWSDGLRFTEVNGTLFFEANDGTHGDELWKTDGTTAGTALVKDINPGSNSSNPYQMVNANGTLFFLAHDNDTGELWKSDGTTAGTVVVEGSMRALYLANVGGTLFFGGSNSVLGPGYQPGYSLWKTDGTTAGTVLVKQINLTSNIFATTLADVNGTLFAAAYHPAYGTELWKSDGTTAGTLLVKDINPTVVGKYSSGQFTGVGATTFFTATDGATGGELWKSDGTTAGTGLVKDIRPGYLSSGANNLTNVNNTLFFVANDGIHGYELWKSDCTTAGTVMVKDIQPGSSSSNPSNLTNVGGTLFFTANDGTHDKELWKSDGTAAGTVMVADIAPNGVPSSPHYLTNFEGTLFFAANDGTHGNQVWKSDGTGAGTVLLLNAGQPLSNPGPMFNLNGTLFFDASNELYKTDDGRTVVGVANFRTAAAQFTNVNGELFFTANDGTTGNELWKSDGTAGGTILVKDIYARWRYPFSHQYPYSSNPINLTNVNDTLFFQANDGTTGKELWKSDGTAGGTLLVKDIYPGVSYTYNFGTIPASSYPSYLTNLNGVLLFTADSPGVTFPALFMSDGTAAGTVIAATLSDPQSLANINGTLFLSGTGSAGVEPYIIQNQPPIVSSIAKADHDPTNAAVVHFTVTFSTGVFGVDATDFVLTSTGGISGASITNVTGSGGVYVVTASTGSGDGTLGLNLVDDDSIADQSGNRLGGTGLGNGNFTGPAYTIDKTAPAVALTSVTNPINFANEHNTIASGTGEEGAGIAVVAGDGTHTTATYTTTVANDGTWSIAAIDVGALSDGTITYTATATDSAGNAAQSSLTATKNAGVATVASSLLFYHDSTRFDTTGNPLTPLPFSDDNAIATDKTAYLPGSGAATFANVSSYSLGINGVMVDLLGGGSHTSITLANILADFTFKVGNDNSPGGWAAAPNPTAVTVRPGAGVSGSDRVELIWADGAITQKWLEVTVLPTANTGLTANDVFFFGSEIGDTGPSNTSSVFKVGALDTTGTQTHLATLGSNQPITNIYDFNRDGSVGAFDITVDQTHPTTNATGLQVINIGAGGPFAPPPSVASSAVSVAPTANGNASVASALTSSASSPSAAPPAIPPWIADRLALVDLNRIDLNSGPIAKYFEHLANENTAKSRAILVKADHVADAMGLDDELIDGVLVA